MNPGAQSILNRYPLPNQPNGALGARTYNFQLSAPLTEDQWSGRIDHHFSEKDTLFVRLSGEDDMLPIFDPTLYIVEHAFSSSLGNNQRNYGATETHIFSPTLLNTFRFAYTLVDEPWKVGSQAIPQDIFTDGSLNTFGPSVGCCHLRNEPYIFSDTVNLTKGTHTMSMGGEYRRVIANEPFAGGLQGQFFFNAGQPLPVAIPSASGNNNLAAGSASPSSLVSFMEGVAGTYFRSTPYPGFGQPNGGVYPARWRRYHLSGWFQDDVKASRKLTLNLGLRYEFNSVPQEIDRLTDGIIDDPHFQGGKNFGRYVLNPTPIYYADHRGFGPRFGMAYKLTEKTIFRGGFGVFSNLPLTQTADQQGFGVAAAVRTNPPFSLVPISATLQPLTDLQGNVLPPGGNVHNLAPNTLLNLAPIVARIGGPVLFNLTDLNFRNGYTMAGNVTLERELPGDVVLQIAYVANNAAKLYASEWPNGYNGALPQFNPYSHIDPNIGEFQLTDNHAHSTYNALQTMLRKSSPSHGLQFQLSYTWSKAIDNSTSVFNGPIQNASVLQNNPFCWSCEKSVSAFDFPHRVVANVIYALPFDKWDGLSFAPRRLVRGWQITTIAQAQSGFPFTVSSPFGTKPYGTDIYVGVQATRPDLVQQPTPKTGGAEEQFFSSEVVADGKNLTQKFFVTPGCPTSQCAVQSRPGALGRNTFRSDPWKDVDFSLIKDTALTERLTLQFRSEFFNIFNLHAFNQPGAQLGSPGFGVASSTVFAERQIQFALRLVF